MKNVQTIIINGLEVSGELSTLRAILGMSEAAEMSEMATLQSQEQVSKPKAEPAKKQAKPKAPKAPKKAKEAKVEEAPKAEEPKAEEPKEPVYTKGGLLLQWNGEIAAKGKEKATITKAYNALGRQGFVVTAKRVGSWIELYRTKDGDEYIDHKTAKDFKAAKLDSGWQFIKGAWKYPYLLKEYDDCFRPEA